jgi:[protein-PII] uridylyltransferase
VPTWLENIEADASRRLALPPGRAPTQELARYREFLKETSNRLRSWHESGAGGRQLCQARAKVMDTLLRHLLAAVLGHQSGLVSSTANAPASLPLPCFALVAIGGYGRAELNPHSDIDILFLHNVKNATGSHSPAYTHLTAVTDGLLYPLWDIGLKLGHSVRTIEECVAVAHSDMQSKTSLLEARFITGDGDLFAHLQDVVLMRSVRGCEDEYIASRLEDQAARRAKYGGSACMQEPNIKNGCGGLRDYQNLLWMAFFKYRTRTFEELEARDLISHEERVDLEAAYDFLLRVRNELHYETRRATEVLARSLQPRIAANLGYADRSPVRRIELFMRDLYIHLRHIDLISRTLEQRLALLPHPTRRIPSLRDLLRRGRRRVNQRLDDGFRFVDGQIHALSNDVFRDEPHRLLRVFLHAQQRGLRLHPDLAQLIRNQLVLVDRRFLREPQGHETFLEILNQRGNVAPILRAMHDVGLLGRYLPEFGRLTCLVQHEFYHQYTADEHTLSCIDHLDRVAEADLTPHRNYSELFHSIERPFVLYLALLLHDVGKARRSGHHSEIGARAALVVSRRLGLDGATAHTLRLIIEHHLLMATVSQRRDLDDPAVIRQFVGQVQSLDNLKLLTLHTLVDSLGTSDQLWNGFKDSLLIQLYHEAREWFEGTTTSLHAAAKERELLLAEVRQQLPDSVTDEELDAHFESLPPRYFQIHSVREIVADVHLVNGFLRRRQDDTVHPLAPAIACHNESARGYTVIKVCTWDRLGLFHAISGSLTAAGLNILNARIFTRSDAIILDTFYVVDARTGLPASPENRAKFESTLVGVLTENIDLGPLIARRKPAAPLYLPAEGERIPTSIRIDNDISETRTVIDLETEDYPGLLHTISRTFTDLGVDISLAKICTEKGAAIDSFYVAERDGQKINNPERHADIQRALTEAIQKQMCAQS